MALDLSRIEALSREVLEAEARRRGVRSPEFRTRSELIRLIVRHQYGDRLSAGRDRIVKSMKTLEQARELLGSAVGAALSVLPEPFDALMRLRGRLPRPSSPPHAPWPPPKASARPSAAPAPVPPVAATARGESVAHVEAVAHAASAEPIAPVEVSEPRPALHAAITDMAPATRTFVEEPIRTRSMARLLAAQGHRDRALSIYAELIAQGGERELLEREADALRRGEPIEAPVLPEPPERLEALLPEAHDLLKCEGGLEQGLTLHWHITEAGLRRARAVLGQQGELALRLVCVRPDPTEVVRSEITEHGPIEPVGQWQSPALPESARGMAAVGLRDGKRFVTIVHAHPVSKSQPPSARPTASA